MSPETSADITWDVTLGEFGEIRALMEAVRSQGHTITAFAKQMLLSPGFVLASERRALRLGRRSPGDVGFDNAPEYDAFYRRLNDLGHVCPRECGPVLRYVYTGQPEREKLPIAMEPLSACLQPAVFSVERNGCTPVLHFRSVRPGETIPIDERFVVVEQYGHA